MVFNKLINGVQISANEEMSDQDCRNYIEWARKDVYKRQSLSCWWTACLARG